MLTVEASITVWSVLVCTVLGMFGQLLRSVIGLYKLVQSPDKPFKDFFEWRRFLISLLLGAVIGTVSSFLYKCPLSGTDMLGVIAASYAGTDWIEGLLTRKAGTVN